jgi:murein L,D-transpeptidase YcbB/YkuD
MENLKFILSSVIVLALLGFAGYWAFSTIESGSSHVDMQKQKELENKNNELIKETTDLKNQVSLLQGELDVQKQKDQVADSGFKTPEPVVTHVTTTVKTVVTVNKNQSLINDLQKLVTGNIYLKLKSQSPAVGSLQKFFNLYNKTSNKIDNDYGAGMVTMVKNYQKAQGLTADGQAGPTTYKKMITWLKAH